MKKRNRAIEAFTLVEVTIALGVVVFCLVSVFGLLAVGTNLSQISIDQTAAVNILTQVSSDLNATPNPVPKNSTAQTSTVFNVVIPASGTATSTTPTTLYIGDDGQPTTATNTARYQLNIWTTGSSATTQETTARLLISWPAQAAYTNAQGSVESLIAINRT